MKTQIAYFYAIVLLFATSSPSHAETTYKTVEINRNLHIFESYLDLLNPLEATEIVKHIGDNDSIWQELLKKLPNKITSAQYLKNGKILLINDNFQFQIIFTINAQKTEQRWTCKVEDNSFFFKPQQCKDWLKVIKVVN